jgi:Ran GTPase-activating protein (RanGAP) involved in mRNA processing and transport
LWSAAVAESTSTASLLRELNLRGQSIGDEGAAAVSELLSICPQLSILHLSQCKISDEGCVSLATVISTHHSMLDLQLGSNPISLRGMTALLPAIQHRLEKIGLYRCNLTDADVTVLIGTLLQSDRMKFCDLESNDGVDPQPHLNLVAELKKQRPNVQLRL